MCHFAHTVCFYTQCALYTRSVQFLDTVFEMYVIFCSALEMFAVFFCEAILPQISSIFCEKLSCVKSRWCKYQVCMELPEVNLEEINVKEYPDLKALCMTYLMEDAPNMKETQRTFYDAWYKINIGEQVLGSFINFLKTQGPLPTTFMLMSGLQYR